MKDCKVEAVIFDMDGTMFDTERLSVESWKKAAAENDQEMLPLQFLTSLIGTTRDYGKKELCQKFGSMDLCEYMLEEQQKYFKEFLEKDGIPEKKGLRNLINFLKSRKISIAVATSSPRVKALEYLEKTGLKDEFVLVMGGDDVKEGKPEPEIFLKTAEQLKVSPSKCMVIEDSINGIKGALKGGFITVMVPDLAYPEEQLKKRLDGICSNLDEVADLLYVNYV